MNAIDLYNERKIPSNRVCVRLIFFFFRLPLAYFFTTFSVKQNRAKIEHQAAFCFALCAVSKQIICVCFLKLADVKNYSFCTQFVCCNF